MRTVSERILLLSEQVSNTSASASLTLTLSKMFSAGQISAPSGAMVSPDRSETGTREALRGRVNHNHLFILNRRYGKAAFVGAVWTQAEDTANALETGILS